MAEVVCSAVAEGIVSQILSGVVDNHGRKCKSDDEENMERLEMAHIKMEAVLDASDRWHITGAPLLRWRRKLKRAAEECEDTLRRYKRRVVAEDEGKEQAARSSSLPRRLAHTTKSLVSLFRRGDVDGGNCGGSAVGRFERFADGAGEFLRLVELGGPPRRYTFFDPLIGRLLAGEELQYMAVQGSQHRLLWVRPTSLDDRGMEAKLLFVCEDGEAPGKSLHLGLMLQLSESTDVLGIAIRFLKLVTSHFKPAAEAASLELAQLPTQDFGWVPYTDSTDREHWNSFHSTATQWLRPYPHCCRQQEEPKPRSSAASSSSWRRSDASLDPLIEVNLQCCVPLDPKHNDTQRRTRDTACLKETPRYLRIGLLFAPHVSSEFGLVPAVGSSAIEVIDGKEQSGVHTNISLEQLDEVLVPKAIDWLNRNAEAAVHQMVWKSEHGGAYLQAKKMPPEHTRQQAWNRRRSAIQRRQDPKMEICTPLYSHFLNLWCAHAPRRLQGSIMEWLRKANEKQSPRRSTPSVLSTSHHK